MELSVSGILGGTLTAMKERFGTLAGMWLLFAGILFLSVILFVMVIGGFGLAAGLAGMAETANPEMALGLFGGGMLLAMAAFYFVYILIYVAQLLAMAALATPLMQLSFGSALGVAVRKALPVLGAVLLLLIAYFIAALVFGLLGSALSAAGSAANVILAVLLIPVVIYIGCRLVLMLPVAAVDGVGNSIRMVTRSWSLTKGHVLTIFLATLVFWIAAGALFALAFVPPVMIAEGNAGSGVGIALYMFGAFIIFWMVVTIAQAAFSSAIHARLTDTGGEGLSETFE